MRTKQPVVLNSAGKPILLNARERAHASWAQRQLCDRFGNALGAEVPITTLTTIVKKVSVQKFFEIAPADFIPVKVGNGAWSSNLQTFRSFDVADEFETGVIDSAGSNGRLASSDTAVDSINVKVINWAKTASWTIFELQQASKSGNWDIVTAKEKARKRNWDLGIQRIAFLGARGLNGSSGTVLGLLNQVGITTNTSLITAPISGLSVANLKIFTQQLIETFRSNCNRTCWPNRFAIPESDYNGLASQASPDFPIKSTLELLEEAFKLITRKPDFKILPLAYADAAYHADVSAIAGKQVYALYNSEEETVRMDIPVDYTNTLANSIDNFGFQNTGYGQFTGTQFYRPLELMYYVY